MKLLKILAVGCFSVLALLGQTAPERARLIVSFLPTGDDVPEGLYKVERFMESIKGAKKGVVAIRVCSTDSLPIALARAKGEPFLGVSRLRSLGIQEENIFFLRQDVHCRLAKDDFVPTEYWFVPDEAELPPFIELQRASNMSEYLLSDGGLLIENGKAARALDANSYSLLLDRVVETMRSDKSTLAVFLFPSFYAGRSNRQLHARVEEARKYLTVKGISAYRIHMGPIRSKPSFDWAGAATSFPDVVLVSTK